MEIGKEESGPAGWCPYKRGNLATVTGTQGERRVDVKEGAGEAGPRLGSPWRRGTAALPGDLPRARPAEPRLGL